MKGIKIFLKKIKTKKVNMIPNEIEIFLNKRRQYERERHKTLAKDEKQTITEYRINYYITHKKQNRDFIIS